MFSFLPNQEIWCHHINYAQESSCMGQAGQSGEGGQLWWNTLAYSMQGPPFPSLQGLFYFIFSLFYYSLIVILFCFLHHWDTSLSHFFLPLALWNPTFLWFIKIFKYHSRFKSISELFGCTSRAERNFHILWPAQALGGIGGSRWPWGRSSRLVIAVSWRVCHDPSQIALMDGQEDSGGRRRGKYSHLLSCVQVHAGEGSKVIWIVCSHLAVTCGTVYTAHQCVCVCVWNLRLGALTFLFCVCLILKKSVTTTNYTTKWRKRMKSWRGTFFKKKSLSMFWALWEMVLC